MSSRFAWLLFVSFAGIVPAEVVLLDFGTEKSPVREGFVRVSEKSKSEGSAIAGWVEGKGLVARDVPVDKEWKYRESTGRSDPPAIFTSDLSQDHVESDGTAMLRIKAPADSCRIWILSGAGGGNQAQVWDMSVSTKGSEGRVTFFGPHASRSIEMKGEAINGLLDLLLDTRSKWLVNAMVVAPESDWRNVRQSVIDPIEKEVFLLPEKELSEWEHRPVKDDSPLPEFSKEAVERGLAIYHRHYLDPVWPATKPRRKELNPEVRVYAARNEFEPMTFTIFPLRDFEEASIEVSDLVSSSGKRISKADVDVRYVRYMNVRPNYRVRGIYYRAPDVLMPIRPRPLKKHENFRVWLTVFVGPFAEEGIYNGQAKIRVGRNTVGAVPLKLRVLPFELQQDRSLIIGQYYHHPYRRAKKAPDAFSGKWWRRKAELEHADMAAHGNNTITMGVWSPAPVNGKWRFNFDDLAMAIDLYRRHGFYQPIPMHIPTHSIYYKYIKASMGSHLRLIKMPPPKFFEEMTAMVRHIEAERKRRQWPEFLYYPVDEPSRSPASVAFMTEVLKAIKQVPGVRTYVTADPVHEQFKPLFPYVDVWCCQPFNPASEVILEDMKKRGVEYWCYPNHVAGENDHTTVAGARMTYGFGFWRSGFRALIPWIYQATIADQWNYLDGTAMDFFNRTGENGEPIPVVLWEAYREGLDDHRYITTLNAWIDRARESGMEDEATAAKEELKFVRDSIQVQTKYKYDNLWASGAFDVYRWLIANEILKLRAGVARR